MQDREADADPVAELYDLAIETYDKLTAQVEAETPPEAALACREGCEFCCIEPAISVTLIEVLRIADHIHATFTEDRVASLISRLDAPEPLVEFGGLARCPLLVDKRCSVYAVRPLVCRSSNSYDATACERATRAGRKGQTVPVYQGHFSATQLLLDSLIKAIRASERETGLFDLRTALRAVLADPTLKPAWLAGKPAFGKDGGRL